MTRIKMCGFRRADDARAAVEAGADAIGMVFWPGSPRFVTIAQALAIVEALPPFVMTVGVFVDQAPAEIEGVCREVGLDAVQLHGDEPESDWTSLSRPVVKAVAVGPDFEPSRLLTWPARVVPLLDAADRERRGGTGRPVDWTLAAEAARVRPLVLAGGLTPERVGLAVTVVRPAAVDVSSGIEDEPGVKNIARMRAFVAAVRRGDDEASNHDERK